MAVPGALHDAGSDAAIVAPRGGADAKVNTVANCLLESWSNNGYPVQSRLQTQRAVDTVTIRGRVGFEVRIDLAAREAQSSAHRRIRFAIDLEIKSSSRDSP